MNIDKMNDDVFFSVTEALGIAGEAMASGDTETLMVVSLAGDKQSAVLGGRITPEAVEQLQAMVAELAARAAAEGAGDHTLHVWR
jgi:hypothetical protein